MNSNDLVSVPLPNTMPWSLDSIGTYITATACTTLLNTASAVWPLADLVIYVPFWVYTPTAYANAFWYNGAGILGNVNVGVYSADGTLLASTGAQNQALESINAIASAALAVTLGVGQYYMAITESNAVTATFFRGVGSTNIAGLSFNLMGCLQDANQTGGLPATASFAAMAQNYLPVFGISTRSFI